jgi:4-amino-4-deoxy-L-arabinose transferase-like glycosyltransferase
MADRALIRRSLLAVLVVAIVVSFAGAFQHELWTPDEPREAAVGREMLLSHFSAMPTLGGTPFLEKPPLFAWVTAAFYSVFGVSTGVGRIPSALFAVGAIWIAYLLGQRTAGRVAGLSTAAVLATMWQFAEVSHKVALDVPLVFFVGAGHLAFLRLRDEESRWNYALLGAASGLAFLTKSIIGPGLICGPPVIAAAAMRDWAYLKRVVPRAAVASIAGVVVFGLPWVLALVHTPGGGWPAVKTCLWTNTIGRSVAVEGDDNGFSGHANGPFYYVPIVLYIVAPWILAAPAIAKAGVLRADRRGGRALFLLLIYAAGALLLTVPSGKRALYLAPLLPAAAVVPGLWLSRIGTRSGGAWDAVTARVLGVTATVVFVLFAVGMGWIGLGLPLPGMMPADVRGLLAGASGTAAIYAVVVGAWILGPHAFVRRRLLPAGARGLHVAAAFVTVYVVYFGAVVPVVDPIRDMSAGVRDIASLVPEPETIVTLRADETTRAVIPFYTGRAFEDAVTVADAMEAIDSGRARHLVVYEKSRRYLTPALSRRLVLVKTFALNATREIDVYAIAP